MNMFKTLLLTAMIAATAISASAGLQPDGTLNAGTNNVAAAITNTYAGTVFDLTKTTDAIFEFSFACNGASTATYTMTFDASLNQDRWITNAMFMYATANGTATATVMTNLSAGARFPFYRVGQVWNTNGATRAITNIAARVFTKTGL